ncbi:hypothetical protein [Lentibacillus persicus]|uniref:hypothetical protein n=1 Tax=Lentibacillus persicus TaxID=640948 RepID=UPI0011606A20|nr:hypothetical protein [Lentibacillus persicus]
MPHDSEGAPHVSTVGSHGSGGAPHVLTMAPHDSKVASHVSTPDIDYSSLDLHKIEISSKTSPPETR